MNAAAASPAIQVPLAEIFRSEIAEARRLGYRLQAMLDHEFAVVRLVPVTQRTIRIAREHKGGAIESTVPYDAPGERLDAVRLAIDAVTQLARDAAA
jgi:hypothetical protein